MRGLSFFLDSMWQGLRSITRIRGENKMAEKKLNGISMKKNQPVFVVIPIIFLVLQQALLNYTSGIINALISYFDEFYVVFLWIISLSKNK